ncbi:hypothetical protein [Streptomyces sp. I05A-00742]|uniref:hypothetical protein n=1 Tax=Streptomyces sp. I05A-00742 TaxID=2732853 RepID=UPI001487F828|nr:hypothetical protein [Streptomyces sp. I05A-00742]
MANSAEHVRQLITSPGSAASWTALRQAASEDPSAALELGHLMLQVSWSATQVTAPSSGSPEAETLLRHAASSRPDDAQAAILLATLLSLHCDQIEDITFGMRHRKRWESDSRRRADEACRLYQEALRTDPRSGAAASGLARLLHRHGGLVSPGAPSAADAAADALTITPGEPVALRVLGETSDGGGRSPERGFPKSPFDYFVLEVELIVSNSGESVPRCVVLRDLGQVAAFDTHGGDVANAVAHRYVNGTVVATHRESRLSGRSLGQVVAERYAGRATVPGSRPLPVGHPVLHKGEVLSYGVNGAWGATAAGGR